MSNPIPPDMHTLTPHLVCKGAIEAIDFYKKAFGAVEELRLVAPNGQLIHAALRIGDSMLMLAEETPSWGSLGPISLKGSPVTIHLMVSDADAAMSQAVAAGATVTMPVADMFWGDRYGTVTDPYGHHWSIAHRVRPLSPQEMQEAATRMFAGSTK
ncbi:MAG: VOC family protein [Pirellulales bacterium]